MMRTTVILLGIIAAGCKSTGTIQQVADASTQPQPDAKMMTAAIDRVSLQVPQPWSSLVMGPLSLLVASRSAPATIQSSISVFSYPQRLPIAVDYNWSDSSGDKQLTLTVPVDIAGDVVLSIQPNDTFKVQGQRIGLTYGSNPRVTAIQVGPKDDDPTHWSNVVISFSEAVDTPTLTMANIRVSHGGNPVAGTLTGPNASTAPAVAFVLTDSVESKDPLTVTISGSITAPSGKGLNTQSWDSATQNAQGDFEVVIDPATSIKDCGTGCLAWRPAINKQ